MSQDNWGLVISGITGIVMAFLGIRMEIMRSSSKKELGRVLDQTLPTSNGFAKGVLESLAELKTGQVAQKVSTDKLHERLDSHLEGHYRVRWFSRG
jgi:hypothetical protein